MSWKGRNSESRHRACRGKFARREARREDLHGGEERGEEDRGGEGVSEERDEDGDEGIELGDGVTTVGEGGGCNRGES